MRLLLPLMVMLFGLTIGLSTNYVSAELDANNAYVLEGSGFAVTESTIKNSQIDFALTTGDISNGRGGISIEDGFVTLNNDDYIADSISGTILRDGKFLRISGTAENSSGDDIEIRVFGRLIEDSAEGSVYSFTGRITENNIEYKILYTSKISGFASGIITPTTTITETNENTVRILQGASNPSAAGYIGTLGGASGVAGYFSVDRLAIEPGTTVTFVNDDDVPHTIVSGAGLGTHSGSIATSLVLCAEDEIELPEGFSYSQTGCDFTFDGRINTEEILPGESVEVTFSDVGFYRLLEPNYPWMSLTVYSFSNVDSFVIGNPGEEFN